jgi:hypothetical protein
VWSVIDATHQTGTQIYHQEVTACVTAGLGKVRYSWNQLAPLVYDLAIVSGGTARLALRELGSGVRPQISNLKVSGLRPQVRNNPADTALVTHHGDEIFGMLSHH